MITIAEATLRKLWPRGDAKVPGLVAGIAASAPAVLAKYGLSTPLAVAHAMAQFSHECGAGSEMTENLSYSAARLVQVWPRHFNSGNAAAYAHNPEKLANFIYEPPQHKDLGNRAGTDDGFNYRGRGLSQTTGRDAYQKLGTKTGLDLIGKPDQVNDPAHALEVAIADFVMCGCLPYAERDDVTMVTRRLNGGEVGLAERRAWLAKWKAALAAQPSIAAPALGTPVVAPLQRAKPGAPSVKAAAPQPTPAKPTGAAPKPVAAPVALGTVAAAAGGVAAAHSAGLSTGTIIGVLVLVAIAVIAVVLARRKT